jgi:hypothetical protein
VTRHDRQPPRLEIALDLLEVGSAHSTSDDFQHELIRSRLGIGKLDELQWRGGRGSGRAKLKSEHRTTVPQIDRTPSGRTALAKAPYGTHAAAGPDLPFDRRSPMATDVQPIRSTHGPRVPLN